MERKDKKWFKRDIIVLISFLILFVSISFLVNIGKKCPFRGSVLLSVKMIHFYLQHKVYTVVIIFYMGNIKYNAERLHNEADFGQKMPYSRL